MKSSMKRILCVVWICIGLSLWWTAFWYQRWVPWLEIISREERWANESRRYWKSGLYDNVLKRRADYDLWVSWLWEDTWGFEQKKKNSEIQAKRNSFLIRNYPADIAVDKTIEEERGDDLVWPFQLVKNKRKIILHHTADALKYESKDDAVAAMQEFYELHTLKHWRWDIWYNFVIDPFGDLYEWRAWGRWVVGAHADWNNASTLWVALMWNFDVDHPSDEALNTLKKLLTVLAFQYRIDPVKELPYFTPIAEEPYLSVHMHDSIVWHKDTKSTWCPGEHFYELLPEIREDIKERLVWLTSQWIKDLQSTVFESPEYTFTPQWKKWVARIDTFGFGEVSCQKFAGLSQLKECVQIGSKIAFEFDQWRSWSSGVHTIGVRQWNDIRFVDISLMWENDLEWALEERRAAYRRDFWYTPVDAKQKTTDSIDVSRAQAFMDEDIDILLYNATSTLDKWQVRCEWPCLISVDWKTVPGLTSFSAKRQPEMDWFMLTTAEGQRLVKQVTASTNGWLVKIANYGDTQAATPINVFRGSLTIEKNWYTHLEKWVQNDLVVVNTLPFRDYLLGIGESSEWQEKEKTRVLAVLAKQYALRYWAWGNRHPSVPNNASYTAIDDPRLFQKYIGAWAEWTRPIWEQALKDTEEVFVAYNNILPILPYYHCSAWFTRSGEEVFGRTDTPWLKSVLDVVACDWSFHFEWHGVWLSGDGAQELALQWFSFDQILRFYYSGVTIIQ